MPALDAFHMKADAHASLFTDYWHRFSDGFTMTLRGDGKTAPSRNYQELTGPDFTARVRSVLSLGETFYISPEMNALVTAAAEAWVEDEVVHPEDFPTDHGFLFIPGGVANIDIRGQVLRTSAITWARRASSVEVILWADKTYDPAHMRGEGWDLVPRLTPWHLMSLTVGQSLPTALRMGKILPPEVSQQIRFTEGPNGEVSMFFPQGWTAEEMRPKDGPDPALAWLVSTLRIMQQPLAVVESQGIPAGMRKNLAKQPRKMKNTKVTVIEFRRAQGEYESGTGREFSHRFLRRGHWRQQWVGSELNGDRHQVRIWIHPTVVGPADKPLIIREHVNALLH